MARTKAVLGTGVRLADHVSAGLLARVFPAEVVNEVLDSQGRNSKRVRSFPAVAGVYFCMALSLYPESAYEEVFATICQGLAWAARSSKPARVSSVSISVARAKIGAEPLQELMRRCCLPMADQRFHPRLFTAGRAWWPWMAVTLSRPMRSATSPTMAAPAAARVRPAWCSA